MKLSIGENIRRLRRQKDLTQEQLADRLGVTYQSVSRWETGSAYPDMELLPAISEIFSVPVDELLGIPEGEKEKRAEELCDEFCRLQSADMPKEKENERFERLAEIVVELRRDYSACDAVWKFWMSGFDQILKDKRLMPEVRLFAEERLERRPYSTDVIEKMAIIEDEDRIEAFLKRYATPYDIGRDALLMRRYMQRNEPDKATPLQNQKLFEIIDDAVNSRAMYLNLNSRTLEHCFAENTARLGILHAFAEETPTPEHPITCGKGVDYWAESRIEIGIRRSCYLASMDRRDEALTVLEDVVSLLEDVMKITDKVELETSRFTPTVKWTAEESWYNPNSQPGPLERNIFIDSSGNCCFCVYPSQYLYMLTAERGWEWFDPIRNEPRYKACVKRVENLVETRTE